MKLNIFRNERGSITVFSLLIFSMLLLAFTAVVIDVGFLYSSRRSMYTAADAGALAGSKEMEKTLGITDAGSIQTIRTSAVAIARSIALRNGAESTEVDIRAMEVELEDGTMDNRDVIVVQAKREEKLIFFRFLEKYTTDVSAQAIATWGYIRTVRGGQILPLYVTQSTYQSSNTLHGGKMTFNDNLYPNQAGFIYIDPSWSGQNDINKAISGEATKITLELDTEFEGKSGTAQTVINAVENRFKEAQKMSTALARRSYMYGLIPIANFDHSQGNKVYFDIKTFAVFEILDVMINNNKGTPESLYGPDSTRLGISKVYKPSVEGMSYAKGTILGEFTGEIRQIEVVMEDNDQTTDPEIPDSAKYSKLVQ